MRWKCRRCVDRRNPQRQGRARDEGGAHQRVVYHLCGLDASGTLLRSVDAAFGQAAASGFAPGLRSSLIKQPLWQCLWLCGQSSKRSAATACEHCECGVQICVKTALAEYTAVRAAPAYKAAFAHLSEQAALCFEVRSAVCFSQRVPAHSNVVKS